MECNVKTAEATSPLPSTNAVQTHLLSASPSPPSSSPTCSQLPPTTPSPNSSAQQAASPAVPRVVVSPCAACKILRRRCVEKCVLAPYFPPTDPVKFTIAHRVFGASNIIKFLQELPEDQRADAVSSMVYEANARIRDPVYGCVGAIFQLQKQVGELQGQLAKAQADLVNMQCRQANLVALICMEMSQSREQMMKMMMMQPQSQHTDMAYFLDDGSHYGHDENASKIIFQPSQLRYAVE